MATKLKEVTTDFVENTTAHGIGRVQSSKPLFLKIAWGVIFLGSFSVLTWQLYGLVTYYYERPVVVKTTSKYESVNFPAVTFCNLNPIQSSKLHLGGDRLYQAIENYKEAQDRELTGDGRGSAKRRKRREIEDRLENSEDQKSRMKRDASPSPTPETTSYDEADEYYVPDVDISNMPWFLDKQGSSSASASHMITVTNALSDTEIGIRRTMGHQISDMLQECTWNGVVCTPLNFTSFYDKTYGNCYTFNSGYQAEILKTSKPGAVYGLSMTLFVSQNEYIDTLAPSAGVRILVHTQAEQPFPVDNGYTAIPGQKTTLQLINRYYDLLPHPYGSCTQTGISGEKLLYKKQYTQLACVKSCYQNRTIDTCGCANPELSVPSGANACTVNDTGCINQIKLMIAEKELTCDCPDSCLDNVYTAAISSSTWPGENFVERIQTLYAQRSDFIGSAVDNESMISKNFLKAEVFFNELKYEEIIESPAYVITNLISDIGGQLGLWLGFSVLTMVEVLQFILEILTIPCRRKDKQVSSSTITVKPADEETEKPAINHEECTEPSLPIVKSSTDGYDNSGFSSKQISVHI